MQITLANLYLPVQFALLFTKAGQVAKESKCIDLKANTAMLSMIRPLKRLCNSFSLKIKIKTF